MDFLATTLMTLLLLTGCFLMFIILLQRGRGGGLAGAFGGLGGQSAFGTKAGDVFTKITIVVAVVWVLLAAFAGLALRAASTKYNNPDEKPENPTITGTDGETGDGETGDDDDVDPPEPGEGDDTPDKGTTPADDDPKDDDPKDDDPKGDDEDAPGKGELPNTPPPTDDDTDDPPPNQSDDPEKKADDPSDEGDEQPKPPAGDDGE